MTRIFGWQWFVCLLLGLAGAISIGYRWFGFWQRSGIEQVVGVLVLTIVSAGGIYAILIRVIVPCLTQFNRRAQIFLVLAAFLIGVFLTFTIPLASPPWRTLEIVATGEKNPQSDAATVLLWSIFRVDGWHIARTEYQLSGAWQLGEQSAIISPRDTPAVMRWEGTTDQSINIDLLKRADAGIALVRWDGTERRIDLYAPDKSGKLMTLTLGTTQWQERTVDYNLCALVFHLSDSIALGTLILLTLAWVLNHETIQTPASKWSGWLYVGICICVWGIYLVAFFPALMSLDSISQWKQAQGLEPLNDWHSPLYTGMLWLTSRVWNSPASAAVVQLVVAALVLGYGLRLLECAGVPRQITILLCLAAAILPVNGVLLVTLWKDIPFSIGILALTAITLNAVVDPMLMTRSRFWVGAGMLCVFLNLARQNGFVVGLGFPLAMFLGASINWARHPHQYRLVRMPLIAFVIALAGFWLIQGPSYDSIGMIRSRAPSIMPITFSIDAQINAGTPLSDSEKALLDSVRSARGNISITQVDQKGINLLPLWFALTLRNPGAVIEHWYRTSTLVWRITQPPTGWLNATTVQGDLIVKNDVGIVLASPIPELTEWMTNWVRRTLRPPVIVIWRAAPFLYLAWLGGIIGALRSNQSRWLWAILPVTLHSIGMIMSSVSQDVRYMYPVQLSAFVLIGLMFLPKSRANVSFGNQAAD